MVRISALALALGFALALPAGAADPGPAAAAIVAAPNALYFCVKDSGGVHTQTPIEFTPNVRELCAKHPEMGPCQYARNECRRGGGRVYAADGSEITMKTEAEYDKKVIRATIR